MRSLEVSPVLGSKPALSSSRRPGSFLRTSLLVLALIAFALPSTGCPHRLVLPDTGQVHQLARPADVEVWCRGPEEASWTRCKVQAQRGWWLAPPSVVEEKP